VLTFDLARAEVGPGRRVLDVGCGTGRHSFASWKSGASVVAFDIAIDDLNDVAATGKAMVEAGEVESLEGGAVGGDAYHLPFCDQSFDVVVVSEVFEHLADDLAAMRECARVLRPDGVFVVTVPRTGPEAINWLLSKEYHSNVGGHIRIYRRRQLTARLGDAGFVEVTHEYRHGLHAPYWWLRCALGVNRPERRIVDSYHRLLVWEIMRNPRVLRVLGKVLDPVIGKSYVVYLRLNRDASVSANEPSVLVGA
jgi:SAM-dependent methyltransferase